jgi:septal ring factor EnvC (AmiA/AmiB activator)
MGFSYQSGVYVAMIGVSSVFLFCLFVRVLGVTFAGVDWIRQRTDEAAELRKENDVLVNKNHEILKEIERKKDCMDRMSRTESELRSQLDRIKRDYAKSTEILANRDSEIKSIAQDQKSKDERVEKLEGQCDEYRKWIENKQMVADAKLRNCHDQASIAAINANKIKVATEEAICKLEIVYKSVRSQIPVLQEIVARKAGPGNSLKDIKKEVGL